MDIKQNISTLCRLALLIFCMQIGCQAYILNSNSDRTLAHHTHHRYHHHKFHHNNGNVVKTVDPIDTASGHEEVIDQPGINYDNNYNDQSNIFNNVETKNEDPPHGTVVDFFPGGESDPCLVHYCPKGRECELNLFTNTPECICQRSCDNEQAPTATALNNYNRPICGSDGMVYENHCELHRAACILNRPIAFQRLEKCTTSKQTPLKKKNKKKKKYQKYDSWLDVKATTKSEPEANEPTQLPFIESSNIVVSPENKLFLIEETVEVTTSDNHETKFATPDPRLSQGCSSQEYEIMKDNLLLFSHARLMTQDNNHSKDFLVSIMFSHYDQNNNGHLDADELNQVSQNEQLEELSNGCVLRDMLQYDDLDQDQCLNINEFYQAFNKLYSVSVVSLDKALETNHLSARVGDNVEIKCDVTGSPSPPIVWLRNGMDLSTLNEDDVRVFSDGSLYLTKIQLIYGGKYQCHAQRNKDVVQTHILTVHTIPEVHVMPRLQSVRPGEMAEMWCHVTGEPFPSVTWLKNDEPLNFDRLKPTESSNITAKALDIAKIMDNISIIQPGQQDQIKYEVRGNGSSLRIRNINYSDTGAYMCQASNIGGTVRDISSLIVQEEPTPTVLIEERKFFVFHEYGIAVYEPSACHLHHQIHGSDIIPGTYEFVCGGGKSDTDNHSESAEKRTCSWGRAINVGHHFIYVTQPDFDRILVVSIPQMIIVDIIATDKYPVQIYYVQHLDQVWILNWRSKNDSDAKTIQVIRDAAQKRSKHTTVHPEPIDGQFDLVKGLYIPHVNLDQSHYTFKYGYVTHHNQRGLYKVDLANLRYVKSIDLTLYNCVPEHIVFSALYGYVVMSCREPITNRPQGQLLLDYLTDTVITVKPTFTGIPRLSPDSRHIATIDNSDKRLSMQENGVTIIVQKITPNELEFLFDVKTTLNISDVTFYESQTMHGYDLYASASDKEDILYLNLFSGKVEMITGVGPAMPPSLTKWHNPIRPIRSPGLFGQYIVTPANKALFVINGKSRTVNCEIGGVLHPQAVVWTTLNIGGSSSISINNN